MKPIIRYQADDNSIWDSMDAAVERDKLISVVHEFEEFVGLRDVPAGTDFANGHGFVQQPYGVKAEIMAFLHQHGANRDSSGPVGNLMRRAWRMDAHDREWGQPYFALNPDKGDQVEAT